MILEMTEKKAHEAFLPLYQKAASLEEDADNVPERELTKARIYAEEAKKKW